jgi:flagellar basal-body rod modification protein FlgD
MSSLTVDPFAALSGAAGGASGGAAAATQNAAVTAERFLRLLVTQMQNQDPLNPMDNAQITSQMAQINTVSGVEKLNQTVAGLNQQFVQLQALQGASLVGRGVLLAGDQLHVSDGNAAGAFELAGPADRVRVEVLNGAGRAVGALELGAQGSGRHEFEWTAPAGTVDGAGYRFRVLATSGAANVSAAPLMHDQVEAVSLEGDALRLQTRYSGLVDYSGVKAVTSPQPASGTP